MDTIEPIMLSREQFDIEMEQGLADLNAGRTVPSEQVRESMRRKYGVTQGDGSVVSLTQQNRPLVS